MKKTDVYTLGQFGVNRVKSPIHVQDGELLNAQNATVTLNKGQLALTKRGGMALINETPANGTLLQIINIPKRGLGDGGSEVCSVTTPDDTWVAGAWSPTLGLFAVVADSGSVMTSPDGTTWTGRTSPSATDWRDIIWDSVHAQFVAVGGPSLTAASQVMTSSNGITWTNRTAAADRTWEGVTYSPDLALYCAVAQDGAAAGMVMTSPDAVTWTSRTAAATRFWRDVTWSPELDLFVAVGATTNQINDVMTSPDGINWTVRSIGVQADTFYAVAYSPELELFVAGGEDFINLGKMMYSSDGINWNTATWNDTMRPRSIVWSPERELFVAGAFTSPRVGISSDGVDWWFVTTNCVQDGIFDVVWSPELDRFLLIGATITPTAVMELFG